MDEIEELSRRDSAGSGLEGGDSLSTEGLRVRMDAALSIASLRYFDAAGSFAQAVAEIMSGRLPAPQSAHRCTLTAGTGTGAMEVVLAWRSPTETLLLAADPACLTLVEAFTRTRSDGCLVDQTDGIIGFVVTGVRGPDLLSRLGSTEAIPAPGEARTGRLADLTVTSLCTRPGEIQLLVERVYVRHLIGWIRETIADLAR